MHINKLTQTPIYIDLKRTINDVHLGWGAGKQLAKQKDVSSSKALSYSTISIYRNLKSSGNLFPAVFSIPFFFIPIYGAQPIGFAIGYGLKYVAKNTKTCKNLKNIYKNIKP